MIALIRIPHQTRPSIQWFDDESRLIESAEEHADYNGNPQISDHGFTDQSSNAAVELAEDCYSRLLICNMADVREVRLYRGHQEHKIRAMVDELEAEFCR